MKKDSGFGRWGPAAGVLAVGMLAFSLSLEGAAPSPQPSAMKERAAGAAPTVIEGSDANRQVAPGKADSPARSGHATSQSVNSIGAGLFQDGNVGSRPAGEIPIMESMTVDYRDDAGTRMRQAGTLVGPHRPGQGAVALGGCSFDIQCDDCDPCTSDVCIIAIGAALGSGTCSNAALGNGAEGGCSDGLCCNGRETCQGGVCQLPGAGTGTFDPGACQFPCSGGTVCNEDSNLCRLPCDGTSFCAITGGACVSTPDCPPQTGNYCKNCNNGSNCDGVETCVGGVCEAGTNPCGPGATCGERDCSSAGTDICTTDSDCSVIQAGTCSDPGPICLAGRCCANGTAEPACTKRQRAGGTCSSGSNIGGNCQTSAQCQVCTTGSNLGDPCTSAVQCAGGTCGSAGTCNVTASCNAVGGVWYATDRSDLPLGSTVCPTPLQENPANDRTLCPKYSSGIAPLVDFETETAFALGRGRDDRANQTGAFSQGLCDHQDIGDDYQIENGSTIAMEKFRWVGGGGGRLLVEFYDEFGNFIEDVVTGGVNGDMAVRSLNFLPPLTIPAKGFWVISIATNFAPNGQTFVAVTDVADEGINKASGPGSLWLDGAPSSVSLRECAGGIKDGNWCDPDDLGDSECVGGGGVCQTRNNVLAFEIEGQKVPLPTGGCCDNITGVCTAAVIPWICTAQGNNYQGNDSPCPGNCGVGACCAADGTCSSTTSGACVGTFQGFGTDCEPNCCTQPVFTGADNCAGVTVHNFTVPDPGDPAEVRTLTGNNAGASGPDTCLKEQWNAVGGTYLTVDPGWWEAFRINECAFVRVDFCCSEPVVEPAWAVLWEGCPCDDQVFTAVNPNVPGEPGNKRGSPYCAEGDDNLWNKFGPLAGRSCVGGANDGSACNTNAQCASPGVCTDGRTYYIPVYSVPPGLVHGQYQMHITVEACPIAACCDGTTCIETDQLGCAAIDEGNFLAPPNRTVAVDTCQAATCNTGSCCYVPGQGLCNDIISAQLATEALCNSANGDFKGGARCNGCVCAAGSPSKSCNDDADCGTDGPCNNPGGGLCSGQNLTQTSPCPVCDFESSLRCQRQEGAAGGRLSDLCTGDCVSDPAPTEYSLPGIRVADDFVAAIGGSITSVCVWGMFLDQGPGGLPDCSASPAPELFTVTVYTDIGGLPGAAVGTRSTTVTRKAMTFEGTRDVFEWQLALSAPIPVTQGNTYWLEVVNNTNETSGIITCDWFWAYSTTTLPKSGNQFIVQDAGSSYSFSDAAFGDDMAWCINLDNTVPVEKQAACCKCAGGAGSCTVETLENCTNGDGSWQASEPDCIGVVCRNEADAADTCVTDKVTVATNSATPWNNFCTNTDGPASAGNTGCSAGLDYQNDLWYTWTANATCDVVIETCDLGGELDTGLMIYTNNNGTCPCPTSAANETACDDDGCVFAGAGSRITLPATSGTCYTIRVASFLGEKGSGVLHVGECIPGGGGAPVQPTADPSPNIKTRFVSFSVPGAATALVGETALRIKLTSLHHVGRCDGGTNNNGACTAANGAAVCTGGGVCLVPYTGGASIPFTAFEGQSVYVGPPTNYVESVASAIPFKSSNTQCTPHYQDWSTVGLLHVTGSAIVPSSTYHVENVALTCQGVEGTAPCVSGGANVSAQLAIKTTRWGDVEVPYNPPSTTTQPDATDIGALVNKFRNALGAPIKARSLLTGSDAFGNITTIGVDFGFGHIAACINAFRGEAYPFKMGKCATGTGACTTGSDCTGANAPPCNLYCP